MSELLDRILREIRERLATSRAAVVEHERLEAALHALDGAGAGATRVVSRRSEGHRSIAGAKRPAARPSSPASGNRAAAPRPAPRRASGATPRGSRTSSAPGPARSVGRAGGGVPGGRRAPRGANREAVLRAVGGRPGVSARELAAVSGVRGGTLYALLRRLTERGELEKRELPGGQTGYALGASPGAATAPPPASAPIAAASAAAVAEDRPDEHERASARGGASAREAGAATDSGKAATKEPAS